MPILCACVYLVANQDPCSTKDVNRPNLNTDQWRHEAVANPTTERRSPRLSLTACDWTSEALSRWSYDESLVSFQWVLFVNKKCHQSYCLDTRECSFTFTTSLHRSSHAPMSSIYVIIVFIIIYLYYYCFPQWWLHFNRKYETIFLFELKAKSTTK